METLLAVFIALSVYGVGVTVADVFGLLGSEDDDSDDSDGADDTYAEAVDLGEDGDSASMDGRSLLAGSEDYQSRRCASVARAHRGVRVLSKAIMVLRLTVYFSLGAGPTGVFGVLTGYTAAAVIGWSAGAGALVVAISRVVRRLLRSELDSSVSAEEYLFEPARISVSVLPGQIGRAIVRVHGREQEIYVRSGDPGSSIPRGMLVRTVGLEEGVYIVEKEAT